MNTVNISDITPRDIKSLYKRYVNPGIPRFLQILGFENTIPVRAEGIYIYTKDGRRIYDFTGGISVLNLGHNHPRIMAARKRFVEENRVEVNKNFLSPYLAALSHNLAVLSPGDLNYVFIGNSGAEANEGALKIAEKYQGKDKKAIIHSDISYHGKTHATLSLSNSETGRREYFKRLDNCLPVRYGDIKALEALIKSRCKNGSKENDVIAVMLEAVNAGSICVPPKGYLKKVRRLCDQYGIVLIIDEVFVGLGRTGKLFAFQHDDIIPDIYTIAKSLGGGKGTLSAYVVRDHIFQQAYGRREDAFLHNSSFSGMGEECYSAIEALNVIVDEKLPENTEKMGSCLMDELNSLKHRHPQVIKEVKGIGLLISVEFHLPFAGIIQFAEKVHPLLKEFADGVFTGVLISQLFERYHILVTPGAKDNSSIFLTPALVIRKEEIDHFINCLDKLLSRGWMRMVFSFTISKLKSLWS